MVKTWGNSAAICIPALVLDAVHIRINQLVDVRAENGRIIIEELRPNRYDIAALIAGITDENRHDPVNIGKTAGDEVW
jgi:antitoxin MazE